MKKIKLILLIILANFIFSDIHAQYVESANVVEESTDSLTIGESEYLIICSDSIALPEKPAPQLGVYDFKGKQLILPASLFTAGALGLFVKPYKKFNETVRDEMLHISGGHQIKADDYIQYLPAATHLLLGFTGVKHKNNFLQRLSVDVTSALSYLVLTNVFKYAVKEKRPNTDERNSFPSGHTTLAFMGAELVRIEYGTYWGIGAYTVASLVGLMRIYNGRHWVSDVLAGAGLGILSARIGYWMLPLYNKWFFNGGIATKKKDGKALSFSAMPSYDNFTNSFSINCVMEF